MNLREKAQRLKEAGSGLKPAGGDISELRSEVAKLNGRIASMEAELDETRRRVAELQSKSALFENPSSHALESNRHNEKPIRPNGNDVDDSHEGGVGEGNLDMHDEESNSSLFDIDIIRCDRDRDDDTMEIKVKVVNVSTYNFEEVEFILGGKDESGNIVDFDDSTEYDIPPGGVRYMKGFIDHSSEITSCFVEVESCEKS